MKWRRHLRDESKRERLAAAREIAEAERRRKAAEKRLAYLLKQLEVIRHGG